MIAIVDYGVGNVRAIANMLKKIGADSIITNDKQQIKSASKLILPGVGAFDPAMNELKRLNLVDVLQCKAVEEKIPLLGICLGMQLLTNGSEEGKEKGLGWIPAFAHKFPQSDSLKVPHMKWDYVEKTNDSLLTKEMEAHSKFYFVHSYFVKTENKESSVLQAEYGITFDAAIQKDNIYGVQFHPEKSHKYGMKILQNFVNC
jgi:imidazole glycerol-phosphate synthase subunit HisH